MITHNPYQLKGYIKPGHLPTPLVPVSTHDTQERVDRCLACPLPADECHGQCEDTQYGYQGRGRPSKIPTERFVQVVRDGWSIGAICREFGISKGSYHNKVKYCQARGLLNKTRRR